MTNRYYYKNSRAIYAYDFQSSAPTVNDGDVLLYSGSQFIKISSGSSGQILVVDPNSPYLYSWVSGDALPKFGPFTASINILTASYNDYSLATNYTGQLSGGLCYISGGLKINVNAGSGYINRDTSTDKITWDTQTITLLPSVPQWIYCDGNNSIKTSDLEPEPEGIIFLAFAHTDNVNVLELTSHRINVQHHLAKHYDYIEYVIGPISIDGGVVFQSGSSTNLGATEASYYIGLEKRATSGANPITASYYFFSGSSWVTVTGSTSIDTLYYNSGSVLVVIPSGYYKKDTVFVNDTDDGVDQYHFVYGQEIFSSSAQAQAGGIPQVPDWFKYTLRLAGVMVQSGSSTIKSIIDLRPKLGQYVSTTAAIITNHEDLVGLLGGKAGEHYHFNYDDYVARELQTNKNIANGYVGLDSLTLISASELGTGPNTSDSILFGNRTWKSLSGNLDVRYVTTSSFSSSVQLIGDNRYLLTASIPDQRITGSVILSGNLAVAGFRTGYKEVLATYTLVRDDFFIRADATSASFGITLPTAIGVSGKQYSIKKVDSTINEITLSSSLSQKIDDDVKMIIDSQWSSISVISDGTRWLIF